MTRYSYDGNGNLLNKTTGINQLKDNGTGAVNTLPNFGLIIRKDGMAGSGTKDLILYSYDHFNRLTVTKSENSTSSYHYNAQGYRIEKTVNGNITRYLYEYDKVVLETDGANRQTAFNVYGSGSLLYREATANGGTDNCQYYFFCTGLYELLRSKGIYYLYTANSYLALKQSIYLTSHLPFIYNIVKY